LAFSELFIEELKMRNPIEDVVSRYVELKRAGRNLVGRCPFHSERSPSFTVFSDHFHCFGCSAGGDVITFAMRIENLDYRDAIQFLADRSGMVVPDDRKYVKKEKQVLTRDRAFAMNKSAARIFHENLKSDDGKAALDYLLARGLTPATLKRFGIGYAKNDFAFLLNALKSQGYTVEEITANFLCGISQKNGKPFDMFRNRVIFPIIDTSGNVVAFGGRVMDDSKPKYLNSSDTIVFKKSKNLFALNYAKDVLLGNVTNEHVSAGEIILCEGYMDVIAMHQAGFSNAVATLGTAITSEHARIVSRYAKTAYLAYDSDEAGKKAADRAMKQLSDVGIDCKVITITGAKDPDEYIKKYGAASFSSLLHGSAGQIDYRLGEILSKYNLSIPDDKLRALNEACGMLADIASPVGRGVYIQRLSELTSVSKQNIERQVEIAEKKNSRRIAKNFKEHSTHQLLHFKDSVNKEAIVFPTAVEIEERIIGILILFPEEFSKCDEITADDFVTEFNKRVFSELSELYKSGITDISSFNENFSTEEVSRIFSMRERRSELCANGTAALNEQIVALKKEKLKIKTKNKKIETEEELLEIINRVRRENSEKKNNQ